MQIRVTPEGNGTAIGSNLLDTVRDRLRALHYSKRTEEAYLGWIEQYLRFVRAKNGRWIHPAEVRGAELNEFLTYLAVERNVAAATQNQALSSLLFLYVRVLEIDLPAVEAIRAQRPARLPTVLSVDEVRRLLALLPSGPYRLMGELMYGSGLRVMECVRLRVKDVDFARNQILVRDGKGQKDRAVPLTNGVRDSAFGIRRSGIVLPKPNSRFPKPNSDITIFPEPRPAVLAYGQRLA